MSVQGLKKFQFRIHECEKYCNAMVSNWSCEVDVFWAKKNNSSQKAPLIDITPLKWNLMVVIVGSPMSIDGIGILPSVFYRMGKRLSKF